MRAILLLLVLMVLPFSAFAHEMRPAYLAMEETADSVFDVLWKVPALGDQRMGLYARLPDNCVPKSDLVASIADAAYTEHWTAICDAGLKGQTIVIDGLTATLTDVLVRIAWRDGSVEVARLTPEAPGFVTKGAQTVWEVASTYFRLGVDHILSGHDHLLFVFALILLIHDRWMLFKTITAFTVAHSITLAGATLGLFSLPQKPVEAAIALSIVFLAVELVKSQPGELRLSERLPWLVAFAFGLLHGFGFAGALMETGLPQSDVPLALLTFNLGVEAGQLMFVALVLLVFRAFRAIVSGPLPALRLFAAYGIGTASMLWLISRVASFGSA
jgi:hydrogenase/urease accessory protein HupE